MPTGRFPDLLDRFHEKNALSQGLFQTAGQSGNNLVHVVFFKGEGRTDQEGIPVGPGQSGGFVEYDARA